MTTTVDLSTSLAHHSHLLSPVLLGGHVGERQAPGDSVVLELDGPSWKPRTWQGAVCPDGDVNRRNRVTAPAISR